MSGISVRAFSGVGEQSENGISRMLKCWKGEGNSKGKVGRELLVSLVSAEENSADPFTFDYYRLRVGGLILAAVLCLIGITILFTQTSILTVLRVCGLQGYGGPPPYGGEGCGYQPYPMNQQYPAQPATVTVQPTVYLTQGPLAEPVKDYLCYSIFTMLCCCLPLGIAALIYSISAREANHVGDQMAAERSSRTSRTLNHVALGLGLGALILYIVIITMAAA
ncbi:hypothetical protein F2P81_001646 [Scophthalmus maximus]|uniref:FXYD domain-containing ion transport regulator n=1 Tax=Scophthalmus maximus TaxID=52904 RepID=A0A6A4TES8_SCOMX|nr:hypothetical protein F2P81_001646 [Scophthalmus maximus]